MSVKISELPSLIVGNLIATANTAVPVVSDITGNAITYQTTMANVKSYVEIGDFNATGSITAGADSVIYGNLTVDVLYANTQVSGSTTTVSSSGSLVDIQTDGNLSLPIIDNGKDVGTRMFYYKSGVGDTAALVWKNSNRMLTYYGNGVGNAAGVISSGASFGAMQLGSLWIANTTATTGARTGSLQVNGGAYIGGDIWSYGTITNLTDCYTAGNTVSGNIQSNGTMSVGSTLSVTSGTTTGTLTVNNSGTFGTTLVSQGNATVNALTVNTSATITTLGISGNLTVATLNGTILNTGNIYPTANNTSNIGSVTKQYNTVFAKATAAQYADLAEKYEADTEYEPGTVVIFGGDKEITTTSLYADNRIAGIISTDPAYLMNSHNDGLPVALRGKVPVKIIGAVKKGDLLVTSTTPGYVQSIGNNTPEPYTVVAKSLENNNKTGPRTIMAVVL